MINSRTNLFLRRHWELATNTATIKCPFWLRPRSNRKKNTFSLLRRNVKYNLFILYRYLFYGHCCILHWKLEHSYATPPAGPSRVVFPLCFVFMNNMAASQLILDVWDVVWIQFAMKTRTKIPENCMLLRSLSCYRRNNLNLVISFRFLFYFQLFKVFESCNYRRTSCIRLL